uniref:Uncharacterized protein n=1 Tax=Anguilla anguilla TaxID=7936 RepID=A0A0E9VLV8_ANGAN
MLHVKKVCATKIVIHCDITICAFLVVLIERSLLVFSVLDSEDNIIMRSTETQI